MLKIRLSRVGKKKKLAYRVVVSENHKDPWGDYIEQVGFYDPLSKPKTIQFKKDRVLHWLSVGAKASASVHNLLVNTGVVEGKKIRATKGDIKAAIAKIKADEKADNNKTQDDKSGEEDSVSGKDEASKENVSDDGAKNGDGAGKSETKDENKE